MMFFGIVLGPALFASLLGIADSYPLAFGVFAVLALLTSAPLGWINLRREAGSA